MSDEVVDMLVELNTTLPQFDQYMTLFPGRHELQWALQDLFVDYMSFCVTAAQYFKRCSGRRDDPPRHYSSHLLTLAQATSSLISSQVLPKQSSRRVKPISSNISRHSNRLQSSPTVRAFAVSILRSCEKLGTILQNYLPNLLVSPRWRRSTSPSVLLA